MAPELVREHILFFKEPIRLQLKSDETAQLLNKPYVNEVTLQSKTYIKILLFAWIESVYVMEF